VRNFLATLILSQGVPMLCGGDEIGRTRHGNNNAYCQDNEISWIDWERARDHADLLAFTRSLIALRRAHPVFRRRKFFQGRKIRGADVKDLTFFEPNGREMTDQAWDADFVRSLMVCLGGDSIDEMDQEGARVVDDTFLLLLNAHHGNVNFTLPAAAPGMQWELMFDTGDPTSGHGAGKRAGRYRLRSHAMALFCARSGPLRRARRQVDAPLAAAVDPLADALPETSPESPADVAP
jgi:isoamylase